MNNKSSSSSFFSEKAIPQFAGDIKDLINDFLANDEINASLSMSQLAEKFKFEAVPENGVDPQSFVEELKDLILPHSINTGSPYFIGHMTSLLPNFLRPLSELLTTLNQNIVKVETAKAATFYEKQALAMIHKEVFGESDEYYDKCSSNPEISLGIITSGGTIANLTALQCARDLSLAKYGDIEEDGIQGALNDGGFKKSVILGTHLGHYSLVKSLGLLGMGRSNYIEIQTDENQSLDIDHLRNELVRCQQGNIHVSAIIGIAGTTECGSFDPLNEMADLAEEFGVYFHVDAAWGGALLFSQKYKSCLKGIERADSITIDGHKQLYLPMGIGLLLFKEAKTAQVISVEADYIIRKNSWDLGRVSIEGSRPAKVFYLQAALKLFGREGYASLLENCIQIANEMAVLIDSRPEFELITKPQSNIFLYRYIPERFRELNTFDEETNLEIDSFNIRLQEIQKDKGKTFVSRTKFSCLGTSTPISVLRVVIANPLTAFQHCSEVLDDQLQIAATLEEK